MANWDVNNPEDNDIVEQYPANERAHRAAVKSNFGVDHRNTDDADIGKHEIVQLLAQLTPAAVAGQGKFYTRDVGAGVIELFYQDAAGTEMQLTKAGKVPDNTVVLASLIDNILTADAAGRAKMVDGFVNAAKLATDAVTTAKILNGAVTEVKLATDSVTATKIAAGAVGASEIATGAVGASEIGASSVRQSELATAVDTELLDGNGTIQVSIRLTAAGQYAMSMNPRYDHSNTGGTGGLFAALIGRHSYDFAAGGGWAGERINPNSTVGGNGSHYVTLVVDDEVSAGDGTTAYIHYITASPPYDLGDGECGLFIFADVRPDGSIAGLSMAEDPPWAHNGPTEIRPTRTAKDGKKFLSRRYVTLTQADLLAGRCDFADYLAAQKEAIEKEVEITQALKNADMDIIPHPWVTPPTGNIVLLDPVNTHEILMLDKQGEDVAKLITKGYLKLDNQALAQRKGPPGVPIHPFSWKLT